MEVLNTFSLFTLTIILNCKSSINFNLSSLTLLNLNTYISLRADSTIMFDIAIDSQSLWNTKLYPHFFLLSWGLSAYLSDVQYTHSFYPSPGAFVQQEKLLTPMLLNWEWNISACCASLACISRLQVPREYFC